MYTHPYIHSSNENSRVDCSRSSSQGAWLAESRAAFAGILAHQPPGQLPLPYPLSREAARMSVRPGAITSQRPKADSKGQHRALLSPRTRSPRRSWSAPPAPPLGGSPDSSPSLRPETHLLFFPSPPSLPSLPPPPFSGPSLTFFSLLSSQATSPPPQKVPSL